MRSWKRSTGGVEQHALGGAEDRHIGRRLKIVQGYGALTTNHRNGASPITARIAPAPGVGFRGVQPDGAFATILNDQREVLLSHRRDLDLWNPPGGAIEVGESPWSAVIRETYEETGLHVEVVSLASVTWKARRDYVVFQFHCRVTGGALRLTDEADEHRYFSASALPENLSHSFRDRLLVWLDDPTKTHLRSEEGPSTRERLATEDSARS